MLRALAAAFARTSASIPPARGASWSARGLHTALPARAGLADLIEPPLAEGQKRTAGRAWEASDLRTKSWDDLHKLWYVLLKERNLLLSERDAARARRERLANPHRLTKVRKSMARLKLVLSERAAAAPSNRAAARLHDFVNAL